MKGFTILELLLSIAIIVILTGITIPFYSEYNKSSLQAETGVIVNALRTAKISAISMKDNSGWSVHFGQGKIIVFKGESFELRDISFDREIGISSGLKFSGVNDIYFSPFNGIPSKTGAVIMTGQDNTQKEFIINQKGVIDY
jgi:prepilin-type N-terminal cleavage/methylation domain-containing protein